MAGGNRYPTRKVVSGTWDATGSFTGGGAAANCTKTTGTFGGGIASCNYNAATGKYILTFVDVGQQIVDITATVWRADAAVPLFVIPVAFSRTAKTLTINVRTEAALTDLATTDRVDFKVTFTDIAPNS